MASLAATLLIMEGVARVARALRGGGKEAEEFRLYMEYDPLLGWRKRAGTRIVYHRREFTVELAINSKGLRDRERDYRAAPGTFRILALGDSFIEANSVSLDEAVSRVMERSLVEQGIPAEVINGGTAGYSTDQEYLFYQSEGKKYSPRIVLLFFFFNDVLYNDRQEYNGRPKPIFQETGEGLRCTASPWLGCHRERLRSQWRLVKARPSTNGFARGCGTAPLEPTPSSVGSVSGRPFPVSGFGSS